MAETYEFKVSEGKIVIWITSMPKSGELNICPVCGFSGLTRVPYDERGCPSFEVCPCCLVEFGYDDATRSHLELRKVWLAGGAKWGSTVIKAPAGWNAMQQLQAAGLDD